MNSLQLHENEIRRKMLTSFHEKEIRRKMLTSFHRRSQPLL